jgi:hypothetical protein
VNPHEILEMVTLTSSNDLVIDRVMLCLHMASINPLSL